MKFKLGPIDFTQPSTWRGAAGIAALCGISLSPELTNQIAIALGAVLSAIELFRNESAPHPPRPLAGEGPGERAVDAMPEAITPRNPESPGFGDR